MECRFYLYLTEDIDHNGAQRKIVLVKLPEVNNGFDSIEDAENWILQKGELNCNYTIISIYRKLYKG